MAKVGPRRSFVHLLMEVLRYHINSGNHNGDAKDYPYFDTLTQCESENDAASTTQMNQAILEDYQRVYQCYDNGRVLDLENEQAFARLLNKGLNSHVTCTRTALNVWACRFVQFLEGTGRQ